MMAGDEVEPAIVQTGHCARRHQLSCKPPSSMQERAWTMTTWARQQMQRARRA